MQSALCHDVLRIIFKFAVDDWVADCREILSLGPNTRRMKFVVPNEYVGAARANKMWHDAAIAASPIINARPILTVGFIIYNSCGDFYMSRGGDAPKKDRDKWINIATEGCTFRECWHDRHILKNVSFLGLVAKPTTERIFRMSRRYVFIMLQSDCLSWTNDTINTALYGSIYVLASRSNAIRLKYKKDIHMYLSACVPLLASPGAIIKVRSHSYYHDDFNSTQDIITDNKRYNERLFELNQDHQAVKDIYCAFRYVPN
jgi:hypothetical protein